MGIFSKKVNHIEHVEPQSVEQRSTDVQSSETYTVPVGLEFLKPYLTKGEATAASAFFSGLQLISDTIASIPVHIKNIQTGEIDYDHPVNFSFDTFLMTKFTLLKNLVWDLYVEGNALAYIKRSGDGTPVELIYCPSGSYTIMFDEYNRKLYYLIPSLTKKKVEPINVIHLIHNSKNGVVGVGIPKYAKRVLDIALATDAHAKNYFESGANIDGILKSNKILSSNQKLDIKQSWNAVHGQGQKGGIAVLGADMDYIPIGASSSDSQMLETREFNGQEVARYLCIDPILIGLKSAAAYNSIEQAQLSFLSHCIYPLVSLIENEFNRKLFKPSERARYCVDFDENHIMFSDKAATANYYATLTKNGIISINEARHYLGLMPKDGADELIIPFTDINSNKITGDTLNVDNQSDSTLNTQ